MSNGFFARVRTMVASVMAIAVIPVPIRSSVVTKVKTCARAACRKYKMHGDAYREYSAR